MRINKINMPKYANDIAFKSLRTDRNYVGQLKTGQKPIIENNKQNIFTALNNMSTRTDRASIEFLLDVADNLTYGQGGANSKFKEFLDEEGNTPDERENTDWSFMLQDTIKKALSSSKGYNEDLKEKFKRIFGSERELTPWQEKLLEQRGRLINEIISGSILDFDEILSQISEFQIEKNLDYFIASSEISATQKQECLEKFITFMSDDYKINPQLHDKKLQVLGEMLNDLLIKTPENEVLTIKTVDQRQSGMCAAISICRKAIAYEDKSRYVDLIMEELKDSPVMSVFDVTELGSGKRVDIPKTEVDFTAEMEKGYRIIDASAHHWMHNAHASGDGTLLTEHYFAPSDDNYGIFDDTSWYMGLNENAADKKPLLMAVIKEKEFIESYTKSRDGMRDTQKNLGAIKKQALFVQSASMGKLNSIFSQIFPDKSDKDISALIKSVFEFYTSTGEDNEVKVPSKLPDDVKAQIIADYIINSTDGITDEQKALVKSNAKKIYDMVDTYTDSDSQIKKIKRFSSPKNRYALNKKLFKAAAAHRIAIEEDVNLDDGVIRFERFSGLPPREIQVSNALKTIRNTLPEAHVEEFASDSVTLESIIPQELDSVLNTLFHKSLNQLVVEMFNSIIENIEQGDTEILDNIRMYSNLGKDKISVLKNLNKIKERVEQEPSKEVVGDAIRILGYEDKFHFAYGFVKAYADSLSHGVSEEQYAQLVEQYGGEEKIDSTINSQAKKLQDLRKEYEELLEKWHVPSSRMLILDKLEKDKNIISRTRLDMLQNHFRKIDMELKHNEPIKNYKKRMEANQKLFTFSEEEENIFNSIEKQISSMRKYANGTYKVLNELLFDDLEAQYANIGMLNGQFWVREEGSSGLSLNEQIRILEQMTGEPYHSETDIEQAAKEIKKGKGSGIINLSVLDDDYGFHAQYVPSVTSETFVNPITKIAAIQDVIWTDNSWGNSEKDSFWNGRNGYLYTDYNNGYGWKNGFILAPDHTIGLKVEDIFGAVGNAKSDNNEKFGLFSDVILHGAPASAYQKLYKLFDYIFSVDSGKTFYSKLEKKLLSGAKISPESLDALDDIAEKRVETISRRINKEIKSKQDFDKLAQDDELRFIFDKIAVYMYLYQNNDTMRDELLMVQTPQELEAFKDDIFAENLEEFACIIGKSEKTVDKIYLCAKAQLSSLADELNAKFGVKISDSKLNKLLDGIFTSKVNVDSTLDDLQTSLFENVDKSAKKHIKNQDAYDYFTQNAKNIIAKEIEENVRIKSLDTPIIVNSPLYDEFIDAVDKYLKPDSQEQLLTLVQQMQDVDAKHLDSFFDSLTFEDLGINFKEPYECVKLLNADDSIAAKALSEVVSVDSISSHFKSDSDENSPDELYRDLFVKLSYLDAQKYIKSFKAEAFQKYKVRQAFPQPVVLSENDIQEGAANMLKEIQKAVQDIKSNQYVIDIITQYEKMISDFSSKYFFRNLKEMKDTRITESNLLSLNKFVENLSKLQEQTKDDNSLNDLNSAISGLISAITESDGGIIDGKKAGSDLKKIISIFEGFYSNNANKDYFIQLNKDNLRMLKQQIQFYVNANIDPKYKDEVVSQLNKYIGLLRDNAPMEEILYEAEVFAQMLGEKHIVKNPVALLHECVNLSMQNKINSEEYNVLKSYLLKALRVAQQTKIQYKLVQNQHLGISSKLKDMLPMFSVTLTNGTKEPIDSEIGMLYLIDQLSNEGDNYSNLNLFLNQTGLNGKALTALINNFGLDKSKEAVDKTTEDILSGLYDLEVLTQHTLDFIDKSQIKYPTIKNAVEELIKYIKRQYRSKDKNNVLKTYVKYMNSIQYSEAADNIAPSIIMTLLNSINGDALNNIAEQFNMRIEYLTSLKDMIEQRAELIDSIDILPDTNEDNIREKFLTECDDLLTYIDEQIDKISQAIGNFSQITKE